MPSANTLYARAVGFNDIDVPLSLSSSVSLIATVGGLGMAANGIDVVEISDRVISWCYRYPSVVKIPRQSFNGFCSRRPI